MTLAEASAALGTPVVPDADSTPAEDPNACGVAMPKGTPPGVSFMVVDGRIARVDVFDRSATKTVSGMGIGNTEAEIKRVYGARITVKPHPYVPTGQYLVYTPASPSQRTLSMIFETDGQKVTSFRAGEREPVGYIEGCA